MVTISPGGSTRASGESSNGSNSGNHSQLGRYRPTNARETQGGGAGKRYFPFYRHQRRSASLHGAIPGLQAPVDLIQSLLVPVARRPAPRSPYQSQLWLCLCGYETWYEFFGVSLLPPSDGLPHPLSKPWRRVSLEQRGEAYSLSCRNTTNHEHCRRPRRSRRVQAHACPIKWLPIFP